LSEWYIRNIRKVSDFFYNNIWIGFQAKPWSFMGWNLGNNNSPMKGKTTCKTKNAKACCS
jgi:hypothetical protein